MPSGSMQPCQVLPLAASTRPGLTWLATGDTSNPDGWLCVLIFWLRCVSRNFSLGRAGPRLRDVAPEHETARDREVEHVGADLDEGRTRAIADQPIEESADEALIVEDERGVPGRRRLRQE